MKITCIALILFVVSTLPVCMYSNVDRIKKIIYEEVDITQPLEYKPFGKMYSEHCIDFTLAHYFPECMLYKYYIDQKCDHSFPHFIEQEGQPIQFLRGHANYIHDIIQLNSQFIASASADKTIKIWDLETNECVATLEGHTDEVHWITRVSKKLIATCSDDETIKVWDWRLRACVPASTNNLLGVWGGLAKLDNTTMALAFNDNSIQVWGDNRCQALFRGHTDLIYQVIKLDDFHIASCSADTTIRIWNVHDKTCVATLKGHTKTVCCLAKIDKDRIASCSHDGTVKIWDLNSHDCLDSLDAHPNNYDLHMTVLADGNIASCAGDGIKIWDSHSGKCIAHYTVKNGWVSYITQLTDGRIAVNHSSQALGSCAMLRVWDLYPRELSFEQIALIVHLEKYFAQNVSVNLGDGWRNIFEILPQYFQNRFERIIQLCKL